MSETDEQGEAGEPRVLGSLGGGPYDTSLGLPRLVGPGEEGWAAPEQPAPRVSRRKREAPADDRLRLPRGGMAGLRTSGGLLFRSVETIVFRDGRVRASRVGGGAPRSETAGQLSDAELAALAALAAAADLAGEPSPQRTSPDVLVHEVAVRLGRRQRRAEAPAGSVPETLAPLIERLAQIGAELLEQGEAPYSGSS